jgi:ribonucleoside-diphosphate reductase alpha chain
VREQVTQLTDGVVAALVKRKPEGGAIHIEEIQDQVELQLMRGGEHEVARAYVLYREKRSQERAAKTKDRRKAPEHALNVVENGVKKPLDLDRLTLLVKESCAGLADVDPDRILKGHAEGSSTTAVAIEEVRKGVVLSRPRADREGSRVLVRHRAPAPRRAALRGARRGSRARRHGDRSTPSTSRAS